MITVKWLFSNSFVSFYQLTFHYKKISGLFICVSADSRVSLRPAVCSVTTTAMRKPPSLLSSLSAPLTA